MPALSEPADADGWHGEKGSITDVLRRSETNLAKTDAYVSPRAAAHGGSGGWSVLPTLGVARSRALFYDKFTTTGDP